MHFDELLIKRRSVRNFKDQPVGLEMVKALIKKPENSKKEFGK